MLIETYKAILLRSSIIQHLPNEIIDAGRTISLYFQRRLPNAISDVDRIINIHFLHQLQSEKGDVGGIISLYFQHNLQESSVERCQQLQGISLKHFGPTLKPYLSFHIMTILRKHWVEFNKVTDTIEKVLRGKSKSSKLSGIFQRP